MYCYSADSYKKKSIGAKAAGLLLLQEMGLRVPPFVIIPADKIETLYAKHEYDAVQTEIASVLPVAVYAVRSNALIEDTADASYAGQFETKTAVPLSGVAQAVEAVIAQADTYLAGDLKQFSVIIQEYIEPDVSGVLFTRSPDGARNYVLEYHNGAGEALVSGEIIPQQLQAYWHQQVDTAVPNWNTMKQQFLQIEKKRNHPQDIEWCIKENSWYVLQSRPITTITAQTYKEILFLETALAAETAYRFIKNDITDIIGEAVPFSVSLLEAMYADNGPVCAAYAAHGIRYTDTHMLKQVGQSLFIDVEKEIHSLLPAYSVMNKARKPSFSSMRGAVRTLHNIIRLSLFRSNVVDVAAQLNNGLGMYTQVDSIAAWKESFMKVYGSIFEANVLSTIKLQTLSALLKKEPYAAVQVMNVYAHIDQSVTAIQPPTHITGNGLAIADTSVFTAYTREAPTASKEMQAWWNSLSAPRKQYLQKHINAAATAERLREIGRWVTVSYMHTLRTLLKGVSDAAFASLDELLSGNTKASVRAKRKKEFYALVQIQEQVLDSDFFVQTNEILGVSSGCAEGMLVDVTKLSKIKKGKFILYTDVLAPHLTTHFSQIEGIYAQRGGMLSHLAIMAREAGIPVVIGGDWDSFNVGDVISINGSTGQIWRK